MKKILVISPHLDDSVLSCGDLIYKYIRNGDIVDVLTIFSGCTEKSNLSDAAKRFHSNCFLDEKAMIFRKKEDIKAHQLLGCNSLYLDRLECLYRKDKDGYLYPNLNDIYHLEYKREKNNINELVKILSKYVKGYDVVYAPMGLGCHADHLLVNEAVKRLEITCDLYFYEEVAYVCYYYRKNKKSNWGSDMSYKLIKIDDLEYEKKIKAILLYRSQLGILWKNRIQLENDLKKFSYKYGKERYMRVWYYDNKK